MKLNKLIAILSLLLSSTRLLDSLINFSNPQYYGTNILYLIMPPKWTFFIGEWKVITVLFLSGILLLLKKKYAYYFYNVFFIVFILYSYPGFFYPKFNFVFISDVLLFIFTLCGLYCIRKCRIEQDFKINKKLRPYWYIIIAILYIGVDVFSGILFM